MVAKRKDKEVNQDTPAKNKRVKQDKVGEFSDDDLSDIDDDGEIFHGIRIPAELPPIMSAEENPGPRMIIKNIVANNFKSYYGKVTIGTFHKSLTSIVGANGSGKSNVIDSLLFVFGYRSTKIRSKKVSVLLHKSDKHKDVNQCSVTVNFVLIHDDDSEDTGFVPIPGSEITITRTAFKDNSSFYTLNNKRVRFKEVATILKKNGIDLIHNRFLILQGEVEQIAMMKPKAENEHSTGMLEYLEDVIGTVRYKKPIAKLEEKVQVLATEKNDKMTRLKFIAKERDELVEPAMAVIDHLKLENRCSMLHNKQNQILIYNKKKVIKTQTEELNSIKEKINSIKTELADIDENKKVKKNLLDKLSKELALDVKKSANQRKKYDSAAENDNKLVNDNKLLGVQIKNYETSIKTEKKKISKAEGVPKLKEAELKQLQSQLAPLENECIKLEDNYAKINSSGFEKSKKFREEKDELAPEELKLQKLVGSKQNRFQTLKTEFEVLLDTEKSEKEKLSRLEKQLTIGTDEFQENTSKKQKAEIDIKNCRDTIKDLELNIEKLKNDEQRIKTNLNNVRQSLTEKRTAYAETTERSRPIQYVLKLKDSGQIRGILGRCGDYGQVEGKYDIPACTACGSTDQIVVETSDAAHACIQKLKANNVGRLTFSILPQVLKLKPRADAVHKYPENSKRVFDLIQILDQRFRLTFYSGLYDTLLAENLEQARKIAFGTQTRYRVVTYKGDLIDQSGIMSGGGRAIKGKIGPQETTSRYAGGNVSQVSQNEVESLDKISKDLEVKLRETQSNIYDFQANIEENHRRIEELNIIVKQCSSRINAWKEKENQIKKLIEDQQLVIVKKKTDPIAVAKKEAEIKNAEKELEKAQVEYNKIKSKVDCLKKKIEDITEGEPREAKRLLDEATNKLDATRNGINQVNVDIQTAERQIKKSETQIEKLTSYINECNAKIESNNEEIKKNGEFMVEQHELLEELGKKIDEQKKKIKQITDEEDEYSKRNNELRKNEIQLKQELDNIESIVASNKEKCKKFKLELSKLKLHEIPEFDNRQRDPVIESYKASESQGKSHDKSTLNKENENEPSEKNEKSPEKDVPNKMNVDDDSDISLNDCKELPQYTDEQLESFDFEKVKYDYVLIQEEVIKNKPNFSVLEEYKKRNQQYNERADEVAEVSKLYNDHNEMVNKVRQRRKDEFMASFRKITIKLKEMYQMITLGGDAELELCDSLDPFSEGVNFSVRPPKKTWKVISNLSGGEKTLSSLALVFALHYYKPSPLYVMDEIDAALDFKNVSIIAYYIKERTKNSQFIIISLRSNMFEKANSLVGIYKTNDCTQTVSINTSVYENLLPGSLANQVKKDSS